MLNLRVHSVQILLLEFFHKKHQGRALLVHSLTPIQNSNASKLFMTTLFAHVLQFEHLLITYNVRLT